LAAALPGLTDASTESSADADIQRVLCETADRLADNYPYHSPMYAGQMLKPPHPLARLAYGLAMHINPNNHALDGGRASSQMEKEAVADLAAMFGWKRHLGHLTSGGTMANLEALWVAGQLRPGQTIVASTQAHYTHTRISKVLQLPCETIGCDDRGRLDPGLLEKRLKKGGVGTVFVTIGTTATGSIDPLPEVIDLQKQYNFRIHADAAYGGYYMVASSLEREARRSYDCLRHVDSLVIDPHKHGLQPYGCGCVLFRDPAVGRLYKHDSPYTYFSSQELHLGEISLECSRAGAAAVGLWATHRLLPPVRGGAFADNLDTCRHAALALFERITADERFVPGMPPQLDIVTWIPRAASPAAASRLSRQIFAAAAKLGLHLALAELPTRFFGAPTAGAPARKPRSGHEPTVTCLRSVLMKPEHFDAIPAIWSTLDRATRRALAQPAILSRRRQK